MVLSQVLKEIFTIRIKKFGFMYEIRIPKKHRILYINSKVWKHRSIIFKKSGAREANKIEK